MRDNCLSEKKWRASRRLLLLCAFCATASLICKNQAILEARAEQQQQQHQAGASEQVALNQASGVEPAKPAEESLVATATQQQQQQRSDDKIAPNNAASSSSSSTKEAAANSGAAKEGLQAAESGVSQQQQQQQQAPDSSEQSQTSEGVAPQTASSPSSAAPQNSNEQNESEQTQLQQQTKSTLEESGAAPAVSGLANQDEAPQQQAAEQANSGSAAGINEASQQQQLQQQQEQQQSTASLDPEQQLIASVGDLQAPDSPPESTRLRGQQQDNSNQIASSELLQNFGRKVPTTIGEQQQITEQQSRALKGRSLKRAFAGHMGVFGRKRTSTNQEGRQEQVSTADEVANQQLLQQQAQAEIRQTSARLVPNINQNNNHYFYQTLPSSTQKPANTGEPRMRGLKNADYPDFSEILVQPDQNQAGERVRDSQAVRARQQSKQATQQQVSLDEQQPIEQQQVEALDQFVPSVAEDVANNNQQQQQERATSTTSSDQQQQQVTINGDQSEGAQQVGNQQQQQPFIRLSNIATINSTSGDSNSNSTGNGEVKLMRIYVIDLDQKLVVGANHGGADTGNAVYSSGLNFTSSGSNGTDSNATGQQEYSTPELKSINDSRSSAQQTQAATAAPSYAQSVAPAYSSSTSEHVIEHYSTAGPQATHILQNTASADQRQHQQQRINLPEGYVLLDREALHGNLSQLMAQMNLQQQPPRHNYSVNHPFGVQQAEQVYAPAQANYSVNQAAHQAQQPSSSSYGQAGQQQTDHQHVYTPIVVYEPSHQGSSNSSAAQASVYSGGPGASYNFNTNDNENTNGASKGNGGYYPAQVGHQQQQGEQFVAAYPASMHAQVNGINVVHSAVPQYIAPQYKSNNPDNNSNQEYEWHQQQQQQQHQPSELAPGRQQVHYNYAGNNYNSSKATHFVQAPDEQQQQASAWTQDKHHANNKSQQHLNIYHQERVVYQQQQTGQQLALDPSAVIGASYSSAHSPPYPSPVQSSEPAQLQQQPAFAYQSQNEAQPTYKVTTTSTSADHWKPVDYSAPAAKAAPFPSAAKAQSSYEMQTSIRPAHYSNANNYTASSPYNGRPSNMVVNGYSAHDGNRDHDVVSLAKQQQDIGSTLHAPVQQYGYGSAYGAAANGSDMQHAPVNYLQQQQQQPAKKFSKQLVYNVNTAQPELQGAVAPETAPAYAQSGDNGYSSAQHSAYQQSADLAPSQQLGPHAHPSSTGARLAPLANNGPYVSQQPQYNATGQQQPHDDYYQQQQQVRQAPVTNEYLGSTKAHQQAHDQHHFGAGQHAVYGNPRQQQGQPHSTYQSGKLIHFNAPTSDQSSHGKASESTIPKTPHSQPAVTATYNKSPPSAYLSVSGPPVADGVYVDQPGATQQLADETPVAAYVAKGSRPQTSRGKKQARGKQARGNKNKQQYVKQQQEEVDAQQYYQQQAADAEAHQQPPLYLATSNVGNGQRGPLTAVVNYYRAPAYSAASSMQSGGGGGKGLLSWETISSVASGAAKRLPSLSSILMPFSSTATGSIKSAHPLYPTYQQHQSAQNTFTLPTATYLKSAHYERDVSQFHRPYPLRHMNEPVSGYTDKTPAEQQQQDEYSTGDLSSSSSGASDASAESSGQSDEVDNSSSAEKQEEGAYSDTSTSGASLPSNESVHATLEPIVKVTYVRSNSASNYTSPSATDDSSEEPLVADLAEIENPPPKRPAAGKRPKGKKVAPRPAVADSTEAVLSSIEHQLGGASVVMKPSGGKRRNRPHKHAAQIPLSPEGSLIAPGDFVDPTVISSSPYPYLNHHAAPLEHPASGSIVGPGKSEHKLPVAGIMFPGSDMAESSEQRLPHHSQRQHSMQIGQYKITPQTQFVHNIIEPSRQMLGQYFKQYIGQLSQFAVGR